MTQALVIDERAVHTLLNVSDFPANWFADFRVPSGVTNVSLRRVENTAFLLSNSAKADSRCVVFCLKPDKFFGAIEDAQRSGIFQRSLRAALSTLDQAVTIPRSWAPYHHDNFLLFHALTLAEGRQRRSVRVILEQRAQDLPHVLVSNLIRDGDQVDLRHYHTPDDVQLAYTEACLQLEEALTMPPEPEAPSEDAGDADWSLDDPIAKSVTRGWTFGDWYAKHLTRQQRKFVDHEMHGPAKLRGAAGTGKTVALVAKALKEVHDAEDDKRPFRCALLTHSWNSAESIRLMVASMDERDSLRSRDDGILLEILTLQALATRSLSLNSADAQPLSEDGYEGKILQHEIVLSLLGEVRRGDWPLYQPDCSPEFRRQMATPEDHPEWRFLAWNVMNEFACVIGAERGMTREAYLRLRRQAWMIPLSGEGERALLFDLYGRFVRELKDLGVLGTYQVMYDFLRQLDFYSWDQLRATQGYDLVLVDEFHLFNHQERLAFPFLTRDPVGPRRVAMALDPRQSPRETYFGLPSAEHASDVVRGLGTIESFKLETVFRNTPQISAVVQSLDEAWPGVDLHEDWNTSPQATDADDGDKPRVHVLANEDSLYRTATTRARALAGTGRSGSRARVAVLCLDHDRFGRYMARLRQSELDRRCFIVRSRDDSEGLRYAGKRFVLSQPEYVAGLQFDTVLLLDANDSLVPGGMDTQLQLRRVLSMLYLGMSRAERTLEIYASDDLGGLTRYLRGAVDRALVEVAPRGSE